MGLNTPLALRLAIHRGHTSRVNKASGFGLEFWYGEDAWVYDYVDNIRDVKSDLNILRLPRPKGLAMTTEGRDNYPRNEIVGANQEGIGERATPKSWLGG